MSVIQVGHIKSACEKRFDKLIDLSDVANKPPEDMENFFLTRSLAAFVIAELARIDDRLAAASVVDEYKDDGIDAFYFDRAEGVCYLVQSKWIKKGTGSVEKGDILKFVLGINHLLEFNIEALGPKLQAKRAEIEDALGDPSSKFVLVLAWTGRQELSPESAGPLEQLISELNDDQDFVSLRKLPQKALHAIVSQQALGEDVDLTIMLHDFGYIRRNEQKSYYGLIDVSDILTWAKYGDKLYHKNIRGFKGANTEVNESIIKTLNESPEDFWYFNNGITIVCERLEKQPLGGKTRDTGVFECHGAGVVNGAQTVGSILTAASQAGSSDILQNSKVLVRLISLEGEPSEFAFRITRASNTQNRIERRDFAALDEQQERIQIELLLSHGKEYVYRSGERPPSSPENGCTLDEAAVALACANSDIQFTMLAKREVNKLYEDIQGPPYTMLFNSSVRALRVWRSVQIMRVVDMSLKELRGMLSGKHKLVAVHGNRLILHMVFNRIGNAALTSNDAEWPVMSNTVRVASESILDRVTEQVLSLYPSAYCGNLFKNASKCAEIKKIVENPQLNLI